MKEKYIKSPLNYVGGKYKLLKEILPLFPNDIDVFVDLFGGGFNVGINTTANKVVYNDLENHVVELLKYLKDNDIDKLLSEIDSLIEKYKLSKENAEGFNQLREYYREIRFALSNNLKYDNPILDEWKNKYNVHYLNGDYSNCNYHKIDRSKDIEVLITNY